MQKKFFVTGTDTSVGKTTISCLLLHYWQQQGLRVAGLKPIATGAYYNNRQWYCEDALQLQREANYQLAYCEINPYVFEPPIAPHLAAQQIGKTITVNDLLRATQPTLNKVIDVVLVEGVGGWMVPLNATETMADFAVALGIPVILVVRMRLGALNHALLTAAAIAQCQLPLYGWIANCIDQDTLMLQENIASLQKLLAAPCLGIVPHHSALPMTKDSLKNIFFGLEM